MGTRHFHDLIFGTPTYLLPDGGNGAGGEGQNGSGAANGGGEGGEGQGSSGAANGGGEGGEGGKGGEGDKPLGPAGEKALDTERTARKDAEKKVKALETRLTELENANKSTEEKALDAAKAEGRTESDTKYRGALISALVRAEAGGKLADPEDAVRLLDLSAFDLGDDLKVDAKKVSSAIDELIKQKPYLAADGRRAVGGGEGGARRGASAGQDFNTLIRQAAGR